jgi:hypothetical protein
MKNILRHTRVYLGGNMEYTSDSTTWRDYVEEQLKEIGVISLNPLKNIFLGYEAETKEIFESLKKKRKEGKYDEVSKYMQSVVSKDCRSIDLSDFVIFKLEIEKPTFGSVHEYVVSTIQKKPSFIVVKNKNEFPLWLFGITNMENVYENIDDVIKYLYKIDSGEIKYDKRYWKLLNYDLR